jgi:lysine 6-dehydrogenase
MNYRYVVLGAGRQGLAIAFDLAKFCQAKEVVVADNDAAVAATGARRVNSLVRKRIVRARQADAGSAVSLARLFRGMDCVVSAVPYHFNYGVAQAAIKSGCHFCDLGGNTGVVLKELTLDSRAKKSGVTLVPDTGLMPGMGNTLAVHAIKKLDQPREVHIRCGGLPQKPRPPLNYKLVFSVEGLINEYFGTAYIIRNGKTASIPTFSELEQIEFPQPVGKCEAFVTSGGTSTCPWTLEGVVREYDYKTVRYPGHYEKIRTLLELGFFDQEPVKVRSGRVIPRQLSHELITRKIDFPRDKDLIVLRVTAAGKLAGRETRVTYDLIDFQDDKTGFSAMERTTGFPAAIVAHHLAQGKAPKGAIPLELAVNSDEFVADFKKRGFRLTERITRK